MVRGAVTLIIQIIMMGMAVEEMAPMETTIKSAITTTAENAVTKPLARVATTTIT